MLMRFICLLFTHEQIIANIKLRNSTYTQASSIYMLEAFFIIIVDFSFFHQGLLWKQNKEALQDLE